MFDAHLEAYTLTPACTRTVVVPANGKHFTLKELQGYVGGYVEIQDLGDGRKLCLNEEGKLYGLPANAGATLLWHAANRDDPFVRSDVVVGTVLVCNASQLR